MTETKPSTLLESSIEIDAPPSAVWAVVSDLQRMGEWSPQCRKMIVFGGEVRKGTKTLNVNRDGLKVWPSRAKVVEFEPEKKIAWRIAENWTVWSFELEPTANGTKLTERREAPKGTTSGVSQFLVKRMLGGNTNFEADLVRGMNQTLARVKGAAER